MLWKISRQSLARSRTKRSKWSTLLLHPTLEHAESTYNQSPSQIFTHSSASQTQTSFPSSTTTNWKTSDSTTKETNQNKKESNSARQESLSLSFLEFAVNAIDKFGAKLETFCWTSYTSIRTLSQWHSSSSQQAMKLVWWKDLGMTSCKEPSHSRSSLAVD